MSAPVLALALWSATATVAPEPKATLEIVDDDQAWREPGFRVGIGYGFDGVLGVAGAPSGVHHSAVVRIGARIDADWSLYTTLRYGVHFGASPGLRFSGTVEPTLHILEGLSLSAGVGIAGFVIDDTGARTPEPEAGVVATLTLPTTQPLLGACSGTGVIGLLRLEWIVPLGSTWAMGPALQVDGQWTACNEALGRSDPDTGEPIGLRQFWADYSVGFAWVSWWR